MRRVKFYLDSNVFIFAEISREEIGEDARKAVRNLEKFTGIVSPLIIDEVVWVIKKEVDYPSAITVGKKMFELPLKIVSLNPGTWQLRKSDTIC